MAGSADTAAITLVTGFFDISQEPDANPNSRPLDFYLTNARATLSQPYPMVIFCSPTLQEKIQAVEAFNSQGQIAAIIEHLRSSPPVEYLLEESFSLYQPGAYDYCFS